MAGNHRAPLRRLKRNLRHAWRARTGRELSPRKWVFVVGCYNSGTTLLVNLLQTHPRLTVLPREGVELTDALPRPEQFGWPRLWRPCMDELTVDVGDAARAMRIKKQWSHFVPALADDGIIVEKSPANLVRLEFLQAHFRPAYFIYIVRNGYAVAEGIRRKADPPAWGNRTYARYPIELCARQWTDADDAFAAAASRLEHQLVIRYESMSADLTDTLMQIRAFLQIDDFAHDLGDQQWRVHERVGAVANMNAEALARLSSEDISAVASEAEATLSKYGYAAAAM